jgi:hypothetical protein
LMGFIPHFSQTNGAPLGGHFQSPFSRTVFGQEWSQVYNTLKVGGFSSIHRMGGNEIAYIPIFDQFFWIFDVGCWIINELVEDLDESQGEE